MCGPAHTVMVYRLIVTILLAEIAWSKQPHNAGKHANDGDHHFRYYVILNSDVNLTLHWDVNYVMRTVEFRVSADVARNQWLGVGFSDYGELIDADLAVFWTSSAGVHHFQVKLFLHIHLVQMYVLIMLISSRVNLYKNTKTTKTRNFNNLTNVILKLEKATQPTIYKWLNTIVRNFTATVLKCIHDWSM